MLAVVALLGFLVLTPIHCQYRTPVGADCESGKCCIPGLPNQILCPGDRASDQTGQCQEYVCNNDNTYTTFVCATYTGCTLKDGDPKLQYPGCCSSPDPEQPQDGCSGVA